MSVRRRSLLVTGASSGIGAATARLALARGFEVFGTSRKPESVGPDAPPVRWVRLDVRDDASVRAAVDEVLGVAGRVDALVCNAGFGIFGSVEEVELPLAAEQFETNVFGTLRTLRAVLPSMRAAGRGRIALVGSLAGRAPIPFQAHYSASKAAVEALAFSLHNEVGPLGVRVALIEPGDISTEFNDRSVWSDASGSAYGERIRRCEDRIREILPESPGPELVARAILRFLTARRPRVRYAVGPSSWAVPFARRCLPDRFTLRAIRAHFRV